MLDQRRTVTATGMIGRPQGRGVNRQEVIPVDANTGYAKSEPTCGERAALAASCTLECRYRPLIIDNIENYRCLVDGGKGQRMMEVSFSGAAIAQPRSCYVVFAFERRRHGPAHGMWNLCCQVAGNREDVTFLAVIHDRQLPALTHVSCVRQALAHHVDELHTPIHVEALVTVGREAHVTCAQRHALGDRNGLLAACLHVKGDTSLPLDLPHAVVEGAIQEHPAQRDLKLRRIKSRIPGPLRLVVVINYAHEPAAQELDVACPGADRRLVDGTCR